RVLESKSNSQVFLVLSHNSIGEIASAANTKRTSCSLSLCNDEGFGVQHKPPGKIKAPSSNSPKIILK
ncbi:hypothetical protein JXI42_06440, partial [bacterium]|nr:hypothetical protein [bacterium]